MKVKKETIGGQVLENLSSEIEREYTYKKIKD